MLRSFVGFRRATRRAPARSTSSRWPSIVKTPRSVITMSTTPLPVSGRVQRCSSFGSSRAVCSISTMTRLTPATRSIAPPIPLTMRPGIIQLARSPFSATCIAPRIDKVDMAAADHPEGLRAVEIARRRQLGDRLLAGIDQVRVLFSLERERAHAEHAVLALQLNRDPRRNEIRDQGRDADAEIDVEAVLELRRGAARHVVA